MPKKVDHDRIRTMARTGVPRPLIAGRLRVSERTVDRVLGDQAHAPNALIGTPDEWQIWEYFRSCRETPPRIAYRFGYTRQHMHDYFTQPRQIGGIPE